MSRLPSLRWTLAIGLFVDALARLACWVCGIRFYPWS